MKSWLFPLLIRAGFREDVEFLGFPLLILSGVSIWGGSKASCLASTAAEGFSRPEKCSHRTGPGCNAVGFSQLNKLRNSLPRRHSVFKARMNRWKSLSPLKPLRQRLKWECRQVTGEPKGHEGIRGHNQFSFGKEQRLSHNVLSYLISVKYLEK